MNATRGGPDSPTVAKTVMPPTRRRVPAFRTLLTSEPLRRDSYVIDLCGETMPALEAPPLEDGATGPRPHAQPEAVALLAPPDVGLIRTFHGGRPDERVVRRRDRL